MKNFRANFEFIDYAVSNGKPKFPGCCQTVRQTKLKLLKKQGTKTSES